MSQYDSWDYLSNLIKKFPDTFEEELAKSPYSVKVKRHPVRSDLVMFKYSQFDSDFANPVVRCCRGSVYDLKDTANPRPYLMPFFKFNNYGEKGEDPVNWNGTLYVRDKLDGSLLKLLKEEDGNDLWTTNGSFDIHIEVPELTPSQNNENLLPPYTFASLRDYALCSHTEEVKRLPALWTFMFELISPYNRIIVPYTETRLVLLGCRDPQGAERTPEWAAKNFGLTFDTPRIFEFKNIDQILKWAEVNDSADTEGVVVHDDNFNRVKIKTEHYRSLFYLKGDDHFSDSRIFDSIKQGSIDDALAAWPEIIPRTEEIIAEWKNFRETVNNFCKKAAEYYDGCYKECESMPNGLKEAKKRYASFVMEKYQPISSFLFEAIKSNCIRGDAGLEKIFDKIDYKELKRYWIPLMEGLS